MVQPNVFRLGTRHMTVAVFTACIIAPMTTTAQTRAAGANGASGVIEYRLLATAKTSSMEKELNAAAEEGFRLDAMMGGETAFGGNEVVAIMGRAGAALGRFAYRLLATSKTSTMQKELQMAADQGFEYRTQSVFATAFGGEEVVVILERDKDGPQVRHEYKLLATSKTSTMQKELAAAGELGYEVVGLTVSKTSMGGSELVTIARRSAR